jgi:hypothetical protein
MTGERALEALLHQRVRCSGLPLLARQNPILPWAWFPFRTFPSAPAGYAPISRAPYPASGISGADASINTLPDCVCPGRQSHTPKRTLFSWGF